MPRFSGAEPECPAGRTNVRTECCEPSQLRTSRCRVLLLLHPSLCCFTCIPQQVHSIAKSLA